MLGRVRHLLIAFLLGYVVSYFHWRYILIRDALRELDDRASQWEYLSTGDFPTEDDPPPELRFLL